MTRKERFFALRISLIMASRMLGLFMIFPIFSVYASQYANTTPYLVGLAIGIYGLSQAILQIPFGYLSDQFGRKPMLMIGLIIFFIGSIVAAQAQDITEVIIGRALQGGGAISAVLMAFLADYISPEERAKANAFVGMQIGLAFMLSLLIGPVIATSVGIAGLFWAIAALSVVAMAIVLSLPHIKPRTQYRLSLANFKQVLTKRLLQLDFSVFALHLILTCTFIALPLLLTNHQIIALKDNWQLYLPVMMLSFIGMLPMIILAQKFKKTKLMLILAVVILLISQLLFYFAQQTHSWLTLNYSLFFVVLTLFFIAFNALEAMLPSLIATTAGDEKRGLAMGLFSTSQFLGAFVGGVVGGLIFNTFGLNSVFLFTAFISIIWGAFLLTMQSDNPSANNS